MAAIRILPQNIINRIAAGEVLERPASALKELVENAIDAGATKLEIELEAGGKNLLRISDNGCGMSAAELQLAIQRHATSKIPDEDLFNINSFGFRGEALPAIGSVAKLRITSKQDECWSLEVLGGEVQNPEPASMAARGTIVEVRDIFYATPARLKFMKADNSEKAKCVDVLKSIAMANPALEFSLKIDGKAKLHYASQSQLERIAAIIGAEFIANSLPVDFAREGVAVSGFCSVPTFNRGTSEDQFVFVNSRPVKDKLLNGAIKAAYKDFVGGGRFPVLALFVTTPAREVDVNVHPAKSEVRFRDQRNVSGAIIHGLRDAIDSAGHRASTTVADFALSRISSGSSYKQAYYAPYAPQARTNYLPLQQVEQEFVPQNPISHIPNPVEEHPLDYPLGQARCQLHNTYVIAETQNSIVIVDQHAAHERLVYEQFKGQIGAQNLQKQPLLVPEILRFDEKRLEILLAMADKFARYGFDVQQFGANEIQVGQIPALLAGYDMQDLFAKIADDIIEHGEDLSLLEAFEHVLETAACHNSIRAGRRLSIAEMNQLLRQMESTPHSGQCNHGRPTYVELKLSDVEKLFGRR
jgi:DNA mismatch repair protein MutL